MANAEIDLKSIRGAVNAILDHLVEDLKINKIEIDSETDLYWNCPSLEMYDMSKKPEVDVGKLSDDIDFVKLIERGQSGDMSYNFVHIAPLLRYIGQKIKK
jgi:transcriptional regulator of aromatic amino acid metabolism